MIRHTFLRLFERLLAGAALFALLPLIGLLIWLTRRQTGCAAIYRQRRTSLDGVSFDLLKFRIMTERRRPYSGELLPDPQRMTELGRWLRASGLYKLPALWNVVRGDIAWFVPPPPSTISAAPASANAGDFRLAPQA